MRPFGKNGMLWRFAHNNLTIEYIDDDFAMVDCRFEIFDPPESFLITRGYPCYHFWT